VSRRPWQVAELQAADQLALRKMGAGGVPVEDRDFGAGHYLRPSLIQLFSAERVLLSGFTAENSPFWVNHLVYTNHATVRGIRVDSHYANNDGVDVDSSRYVLVEDSHFRTGDDSVVVKSGRDRDGRDIARPSEYVVVRNNDMGGEDGIALGSEMSGDVREVYFVDSSDSVYNPSTGATTAVGSTDFGDGSGSVDVDPTGPYDDGDVVELTANAEPGRTFDHWSDDLSGSINPDTITMDGDKAVTAVLPNVWPNAHGSDVGCSDVAHAPAAPSAHPIPACGTLPVAQT